jgi:glycosyltransferase involved in cell wall biosynthesis
MPKVVLISNVFHYYYAALALDRAGYLERYITGPSGRENEAWLGRLGPLGRRLWDERRLAGIAPAAIRRLWLPELAQKVVKRLGSDEAANRICGGLFAKGAARLMGECDTVHFVQAVGWEAARKAKARGTKVVCDMREEHPAFQLDILSDEARQLGVQGIVPGSTFKERILEEIELADHIFCPSSYAKRTFVERGIRAERIVVCPYGVDGGQFTPRATEPAARSEPEARKPFCVLFLGKICMRKGIHYLLEGYRKARLPNARLVLAGPVDPEYRPVLERYRGLFAETGSVPRSRVQELYAAADVFVIPSLADSYGLVVSEAMSAGLPVIVSENTGMADFIVNGREGFVVPIRDSEAIAARLTFLHENRAECARMGRAGAARARALDWDNYQNMFTAFYAGEHRAEMSDRIGAAQMSAGHQL